MSYFEAIEDGIRIERYGDYTPTKFYPKCRYCGKETLSLTYKRDVIYKCKECKEINEQSKLAEKEEINYDKKEQKFNTAVERISKVADINKYKKAIDTIHNVLHKANWFQSTEEIMVGIQLAYIGYKINHQAQIGNYKVDFLIKSEKLIIEVDGVTFHAKDKRDKEYKRDECILYTLGRSWNIIRISDKDINTNITNLDKAIKNIIANRKRIINSYGYIPKWYSDRAIRY